MVKFGIIGDNGKPELTTTIQQLNNAVQQAGITIEFSLTEPKDGCAFINVASTNTDKADAKIINSIVYEDVHYLGVVKVTTEPGKYFQGLELTAASQIIMEDHDSYLVYLLGLIDPQKGRIVNYEGRYTWQKEAAALRAKLKKRIRNRRFIEKQKETGLVKYQAQIPDDPKLKIMLDNIVHCLVRDDVEHFQRYRDVLDENFRNF